MATRKMSTSNEVVARHEIEEILHVDLIPGTEVMADSMFSGGPFLAHLH